MRAGTGETELALPWQTPGHRPGSRLTRGTKTDAKQPPRAFCVFVRLKIRTAARIARKAACAAEGRMVTGFLKSFRR